MSAPDPGRLEAIACGAAQVGGEVLERRYREGGATQVERKGRNDYVTDVDREAEAAVLQHIRIHAPGDAILAEEGGPGESRASAEDGSAEADRSARRWIVDPLDGTTNFVHRIPWFAVSVGVEDAHGLAAGAICDPLRGETFHASRGNGARLNGRTIRCSSRSHLAEALVATGFPPRRRERLGAYIQALGDMLVATGGLWRRGGAAALDLAYTGCGRFDGFWEVALSPWDIAAGVVIVREAGGEVTDLLGGDGFSSSGDIVAAAAGLHAELLATVRAASL